MANKAPRDVDSSDVRQAGAGSPQPGRRPGTRGRGGKDSSELLRTAEVLERTGITHQILYRYVTLGLVEPFVVTESGVRLFRPEVVALIKIIQSFNQTGYSLQHLKETFFKDDKVRRLLARK